MSGKTRGETVSHSTTKGVWRRRLGWLSGAAGVLAVCLVVRSTWGPDRATAQAPRRGVTNRANRAVAGPPVARQQQKPQVVATVNGRPRMIAMRMGARCDSRCARWNARSKMSSR